MYYVQYVLAVLMKQMKNPTDAHKKKPRETP